MRQVSQVEKNINLVKRMASSFHNTTGIDYQELVNEATLAYLEAQQIYTRARNLTLNSFAYGVMRNQLINYCKNQKKVEFIDMQEHDFPCMYTNSTPFFELMDSLPKKCQVLVEIILENKEAFIGLTGKESRAKLREMVREQQGWPHQDIFDAIREIKIFLNKPA